MQMPHGKNHHVGPTQNLKEHKYKLYPLQRGCGSCPVEPEAGLETLRELNP